MSIRLLTPFERMSRFELPVGIYWFLGAVFSFPEFRKGLSFFSELDLDFGF
jgi:hypothetical protein